MDHTAGFLTIVDIFLLFVCLKNYDDITKLANNCELLKAFIEQNFPNSEIK